MERPGEQLATWRAALAAANPTFTPHQLEAAVDALRRQHDDPEEHDRSLIAERMAWTPDQRLRVLQDWLDFIERAGAARAR